MALRTTAEDVKIIIDTSLEDTDITGYITAANNLINTALSGTTLGSDILAEIERWLTAHMIASTRERMAKKEGAGGAEIEYTGVYGVGLNSTTYGQMAMQLDTTGELSALGGKRAYLKAIKSFD